MLRATITSVDAREILDSRGNPTLQVTVATEAGSGTFGVPSGASTGTGEAHELRDGNARRFGGQGILKAAANVRDELAKALIGLDVRDQQAIDRVMIKLDGTADKSRLGGNAIVGVSVAVAKAAAAAQGATLHKYLHSLAPDIKPSRRVPFLGMNLINGGKHAAGRSTPTGASGLAFQEYKVVPQTDDIEEALNIGTTIMHALRKAITAHFGPTSANVGDEGGFAPDLDNVRKPLELFMDVAEHAGLADRIKLALDVAASSFYDATTDMYSYDDGQHTAAELEVTLRHITRDFPILYIEDPFNEDAFEDFARLNKNAGVIIVGDDLTVTSPAILQKAIDQKAVSGVIIKVNQVGTLTETLECMKLARDHGIECIVSHRSGETNDDFIADLAVAFGAFAVKAGGLQRGERIAKYNRFLELLS
jgi:enolase